MSFFSFSFHEVVSVTMVQAGDALKVATIAGTFRAFGRKSIYAIRKRIEEVDYKCKIMNGYKYLALILCYSKINSNFYDPKHMNKKVNLPLKHLLARENVAF